MLQINDKVDVYRNLNKGNFSIRKRGKVLLVTDKILLRDVSFVVSEKGRQRVLRNKQKNVHAVVRGIYLGNEVEKDNTIMNEAYYDPYKVETFVNIDDKEPLLNAREVYLKENKIYYYQ
jgi:hypothetical protein